MNITTAYVTPQATHAQHEVKAYAINNTLSVTRIKLLSTTLLSESYETSRGILLSLGSRTETLNLPEHPAWNDAVATTEEERSETSTLFWKLLQTVVRLYALASCCQCGYWKTSGEVTMWEISSEGHLKQRWQRGTGGERQPGAAVCRWVVFYMSLSAGCRWVQAVGPLASHRTSPPPPPCPITMGPRSHNSAARPSSCRFGCRFAILAFGRCVFREQVMSHSACSSAWTRGNPGNSGCRCRTAAGLAGVWWVHVQRWCCWACCHVCCTLSMLDILELSVKI